MRLDYSAESERNRRNTFLWAMAVLLVFVTVVFIRLWYLQVIKGDHFRKLSENNRIRTYRIQAPRGRILDRAGVTLADYAPSYDVFYVADNLPEDAAEAARVHAQAARLLGTTIADLDARLTKGRRGRPVRVRIDAPHDLLEQIEQERMRRDGRFPLAIDTVSKRVYLHVGLLAHVLGYCGEISEELLAEPAFKDYRPGDLVGRTGVEAAFESELHGTPGREWFEENARHVKLRSLGKEPAIPGNSVVLSVDARLQMTAMRAFDEAAGAVVAVDPKTGFLLAAHSAPTFDAELFSRATPPRIWNELINDPYKPLQNRIIGGTYPPGSTYKLFVAAAGLEENVAGPHNTVYCPGYFKLGNYRFRCWKRSGHGQVDLKRAIRESCDVYFYSLGQRLGIDTISRYAHAFGFGERTGLGLSGERPGISPTRTWKKKRFGQSWMPGDTISVSIGQGYNTVTPLQMAMGYCALVNGGTLYRPQVALRTQDVDGNVVRQFEPEPVRQVPVSDSNLRLLRDGLEAVVHEPHGTARMARVEGFRIGGKTGTAQVVVQRGPETKTLEETEYRRRDHAWFVGYGPAEDPRIVVAVIAEHAGHGGSVAAPIAQKVLDAWLNPPIEADPLETEAGDAD